MYREMRRRDRAMPDEKAKALLEKGAYGILSTVGKDGQAYAVPLSYVVKDNKIFFHCAFSGQKIENIAHEPRICFCVVGDAEPIYEKNFTTYYESVIVYGTVSQIDDDARKTEVLMMLAKKYLPAYMDNASADIAKSLDNTGVYQIAIDYVTGKEKCRKSK